MSLAFYRLQQLISPGLPIGAFTYSQGMEWAVECGWVGNAEQLHDWLDSCLQDSLATLELPILKRLRHACDDNDEDAFRAWSEYLLASRETHELRQEECQRARALTTVLAKLPDSERMNLALWQPALHNTQLAPLALACHHWCVPMGEMLRGQAWSWLENMVTVTVKLVPLGQSDGQRVLYQLGGVLDEVVEKACGYDDDDLGASTVSAAIASSLHETQYCRLFRS
ncbi:MAG: urease accessory protein UreF [Gammaproteobacteria bacterium]|nr:urease accessory protein UreF [Gammaproteobacteria bacterium]MBQ0774481.1 urease accessory protein UreF [Gammaproteobacteria bacterium]